MILNQLPLATILTPPIPPFPKYLGDVDHPSTHRMRLRRIRGGRVRVLAVVVRGDGRRGVSVRCCRVRVRLSAGPLTPEGGAGLVLRGHGRGRRPSRSAAALQLPTAAVDTSAGRTAAVALSP